MITMGTKIAKYQDHLMGLKNRPKGAARLKIRKCKSLTSGLCLINLYVKAIMAA
jgi:hypothetical protein